MKNNKTAINPAHYGAGAKHECIDVMMQQFGREKVMAFCQLNAFKYLFRMDHKGQSANDAAKARWYLRRYEKLRNDEKVASDLMAKADSKKGGEA